jgi:DegV family protein with EDD domain
MTKIAIITDSTAVVEPEIISKYSFLKILPLQIIFRDKVFHDGDISQRDFFNLVDQAEELPTTSQPSIGKVNELMENLLLDYDEIIYITLSSKISGTFQTGFITANEVSADKIKVVDTLMTSTVQKRMVCKACDMVEKGKTVAQILECMEDMKKDHHAYLIVDDLNHLQRTGRVSGVAASLGTMLKIKPILRFDSGEIILDEKVRTMKKAMSYVMQVIEEKELKSNTHISLCHAKGEDYVLQMQELINQKYPEFETSISEMSPVISVHTGPKSIAIAWVNGY